MLFTVGAFGGLYRRRASTFIRFPDSFLNFKGILIRNYYWCNSTHEGIRRKGGKVFYRIINLTSHHCFYIHIYVLLILPESVQQLVLITIAFTYLC